MLSSCGSFSPNSFVSSEGIYQNQEVFSETNNGEFYKNYFREKELELKNNFEFIKESSNSEYISSSDIAYTENNAMWGDIPDTKTLVFDFSRTYFNRYFGYGYGLTRPYIYRYGYYDFWDHYYRPWYNYSYWDPYFSIGSYWGWGNPWRYYDRGYYGWGYNGWGNKYFHDRSYTGSAYETSNIQGISYVKGRTGNTNGVTVYSNGKSSNNYNIKKTYDNKMDKEVKSLKSFDILVKRSNGEIDKVRKYQTKPGSDDLIDIRNSNNKQNFDRIYLKRGVKSSSNKRNFTNNSSESNIKRRYYGNSNNNTNNNRRYYTNPNYKNKINPVNRSSNSGTSSKSFSNASGSSLNNSTSTRTRNFSSSSISIPSLNSSRVSSSVRRGSSSSTRQSRSGGPR